MTVEEWLGKDNKIGIDIWNKKYRYNDESFEEWLDRVSGGNYEVKKLIMEKKFLFGGRILANRGLADKDVNVTYSNCFAGDMNVITSSGLKRIDSITVGDKVLSHDGKFHNVNAVMEREYVGDLYKLSSIKFDDIVCTPNHKFLTNNGWKRADQLMFTGKCGTRQKVENPDRLKEVDNVIIHPGSGKIVDLLEGFCQTDTTRVNIVGDKLQKQVFCKIRTNYIWCNRGKPVNRYITLDNDMLYFIGRWLGDGCVHKRKTAKGYSIIRIVFNRYTEYEAYLRCKAIGETHFGIESSSATNISQKTVSLSFENEIIASWFERTFGMYSWGKYVPDEFYGNFEMLLGLMDSDGSVDANGNISIVLCNLNLMKFIKHSLLANGILCKEIKDFKQSLPNAKKAYQIVLPVSESRKLRPYLSREYRDEHLSCKSIYEMDYAKPNRLEILENQQCKVYNLSVDDSHSYNVNGVYVHNCYVVDPPTDSIESIFDCAKKLARTYSYGGGCGVDISGLAPRGATIHNAAKKTTGAVSFMDLFSLVTGLIGQNNRRGALMISLSCAHPDLEEFIAIKSDLEKCTKANISVRITDEFMKAVKDDKPFTLSFTRKETGETIEKVVNAREIFRKMCEMNWDYAEPGMLFWDRIESWNLLSEDPNFHYAGTNPCAEEPLPAGGSCLLGSLNLAEFVKPDKTFDFDEFSFAVAEAIFALNGVLDEGIPLHPLEEQRESVKKWRQIGLGIMGLADMLIKMGIRYGSSEAIELCDNIGYTMATSAINESAIIAITDDNSYPMFNPEIVAKSDFYKVHKNYDWGSMFRLANSQLLTIAPTGTLSTMLGISGGIEPIYANSYTRKTESLHGHDEYYKIYTPIVEKYMKEHNTTDESQLPDYFVTAKDIPYKQRIDMQAAWQKHIDASISSTINLPHESTVEDVENLYMYAWEKGLKGVTIFRDGCKRAGILSTEDSPQKEPNNKVETPIRPNEVSSDEMLPRGYIVKPDDGSIGKKRTLTTGCGTLHCVAMFDEETGELFETYLSKGSSGGCNNFMIGLSRMISLSARGGIDIYSIVDQLKSCGVCPSYAVRSATKHDTSKGSCCPMAIGNALIDMYNEVQAELNTDDLQKEKEFEESGYKEENVKLSNRYTENTKLVCPECGSPLSFEGGCNICKNCGWSKCE